MNLLILYEKTEEMVSGADDLIGLGTAEDIDCTKLVAVKQLLLGFLLELSQSLTYKVEKSEYYGDDLDDVGKEDLYRMIEEVGYEQVSTLFDNVEDLLSEKEAY